MDLTVLRLEVKNQYYWAIVKLWAGPHSIWRIQGKVCSCPFHLLGASGIPWLMAISLQPWNLLVSLYGLILCMYQISPASPLGISVVVFKAHPNNSGYSLHLKILNLISFALLSFFVTTRDKSHRFQRLGCETCETCETCGLLGEFFSAYLRWGVRTGLVMPLGLSMIFTSEIWDTNNQWHEMTLQLIKPSSAADYN